MKVKLNKLFTILVIIISSFLLVYSSYNIVNWYLSNKENSKIKEELSKKIIITKIDSEEKYKIDFESLKKQNNETIGYLKVNNTNIDYIFVKHNDNSFYLNHNFEKKKNVSGWVFADYHNKFDETDKNIIIYGHNTKDGSMFETLINILKKEWYENEENYKIILVTETKTYYYQVFSTYSIKPEDYYIKKDFIDDNEFNTFINTLKSRSIYNYNIEVSSNDKILTLSSCIGDGSKRVVLHAKLIA